MDETDLPINKVGLNLEWSLFDITLHSYKSHSYLSDEIIKYGNQSLLEKLSFEIAEIFRQSINLPHEYIDFFNLVKKHQNFKLLQSSVSELEEFIRLFAPSNSSKDHFMLFKNIKIESCSIPKMFSFSKKFDELSEKYGTFIAIHGSNMNRFYSILQNGLNLPDHAEMPGLFGSGIYLTNKLDVAHHFAQAHIFDNGIFQGYSLKAVAVCEVIKHPTAVVRQEHSKSDGFSLNGEIPSEYFLVKDERMVRVTHIFIQSSFPISNIQSEFQSESRNQLDQFRTSESLIQIFRRHWLTFTILIYLILLMLISYFTGKSVIFSNWDTSDLLDINNN